MNLLSKNNSNPSTLILHKDKLYIIDDKKKIVRNIINSIIDCSTIGKIRNILIILRYGLIYKFSYNLLSFYYINVILSSLIKIFNNVIIFN